MAKTAKKTAGNDLFAETATARRPSAKDARPKTASSAEGNYTAADIEVLEGLEPVRRRPGMYIGGTDEKALHHLFAEVIDNSIHATDPNEGRIEVHAAFDPYSSRVVVTVSDNGCGMDEATVKRAFDPFFSNKPAGRRRGLGLAKALRWIEASGGSIRLESRPGQGTRGVILLPAKPAAPAGKPAAERRAAQ